MLILQWLDVDINSCIWDGLCLSWCRLLKQRTIDWIAHKQQKLISHSFGGRMFEIRMPAWSSSSEGCLPRYRLLTLLYPHMAKAKRGSKPSPGSYKGTNSIHEGSTLMTSSCPNYLRIVPPPKIITLGVRISTNFGGNQTIQNSLLNMDYCLDFSCMIGTHL